MGAYVEANGTTIWTESRGQGPAVLLIAGLSDPAEAWQQQLDGFSDRYRVIAFDNRGSGRTPLPDGPLSVAMMADDAAELLRGLGVERAHVAGFSGGSAIAQELALRHPETVRSLVLMSTWARADAYFATMARFWHWLVREAPDERAMLEAFFLWIYTPRAHADGTVQRIIDETLAFPYPQSPGVLGGVRAEEMLPLRRPGLSDALAALGLLDQRDHHSRVTAVAPDSFAS